MKDHLRSLVRGLDPLVGRNVVREYLQARILEGLQRVGAMSPLAFRGGTALRLELPEFASEYVAWVRLAYFASPTTRRRLHVG